MRKKKSGRSKGRERMIEADNYRQGNVQDAGRRKSTQRKAGAKRRTKAAGIREDKHVLDRTDMSIAQMQRRRRRRRQKELARKKRKFYMTVLLVLLFMIFVIVLANKKKPEPEETLISEDDKGLASDVPEKAPVTSDYNGTASQMENSNFMSTAEYPGATDITELLTPGGTVDTTMGQSAVDLSMLDSELDKVQSAKAAMKQKSYFTGTIQTVDSYLQAYAPGEWYGIMDAAGDVCVFYEGQREERVSVGGGDEGLAETTVQSKIKVVFIVYEDGSFMVQSVSVDDELVDDYQEYLTKIVNGSM